MAREIYHLRSCQIAAAEYIESHPPDDKESRGAVLGVFDNFAEEYLIMEEEKTWTTSTKNYVARIRANGGS